MAIFSVGASGGSDGTAALNVFLRSHRVLAVERKLVEDGQNSFGTFCVEYLDGPTLEMRGGAKVDYRELLTPEQFQRFARLRSLRKELAEKEAVPPYAVFTNEQLAAMARLTEPTAAAVERIDGIGPARMEKYGRQFLEALRQPGSDVKSAGNGVQEPPAP